MGGTTGYRNTSEALTLRSVRLLAFQRQVQPPGPPGRNKEGEGLEAYHSLYQPLTGGLAFI